MASASENSFSLNTLIHMLTIKLNSSNYLLWKNQITPLLLHQKWMSHVDGSSAIPPSTVLIDGKETPNPARDAWVELDQKVLLILQSSLSEESMAEVLGLSTPREVWTTLESAYSHDSQERSQNLKDSLRQLKKGNLSVSDYAKKFKSICDKLQAIGQPISDVDKSHWFLCGLGPTFETFSTAHRALPTRSAFRDLVAQAECHELFISSLHESTPPPVAFTANTSRGRGRSGQSNHRGNSSSRGRGRSGRRPPHCHLCRTDGHYASACPELSTYAQRPSPSAANLAQAFHADCSINDSTPD